MLLIVNWPGVNKSLHDSGEEQHHTCAAKRCPALLLLLHREARLQLRISEAQRQTISVLPFQPENTHMHRHCEEVRWLVVHYKY